MKELLTYLYGLRSAGIKPGLGRIKRLLSLLDNPQNKYPTILVAGTNGKGSTAAMIEAILSEAGLCTGLYTSPHLVRFNERIRVRQKEITTREILVLASYIKFLVKENFSFSNEPSFFEFTTAMAFEFFRKKKVDIAVLEVGMGGRWDATNVTRPAISVITSVGVDHSEYLGSTIEKIAMEKAGIIKKRAQVVVSANDKSVLSAIRKVAREKEASLHVAPKDFNVRGGANKKNSYYEAGRMEIEKISIGLKGVHQLQNAATAIKAARLLNGIEGYGFPISVQAIKRGLEKVLWPGRFEIAGKAPLTIFDCAHNPDSAKALAGTLRDLSKGRIFLVLGVMEDKDIDGVLAHLMPLAHTVILTEPHQERSASVGMLAEKVRSYGGETKVIKRKRVGSAVREAFLLAGKRDTVCVAGSVFTVGEGREYFFKMV